MKNYIKILFILPVFLLGAVGCTDDFAEINLNPNLPTDVGPNNLLSSIIFDPINPNINMQIKFIGQVMQYLVFTNENAFDVYNFAGDAAVTDAVWAANYSALRDSRDMVSRANGDVGYLAAANIMDAYHLAILTDMWRDVPNTNAGLGLEEINPSYDSQDAVFADILNRLAEADGLLAGSGTKFGQGGDVLFGGDIDRWRRMANSLRLKYLLRVSNVMPSAQSQFEQIVNGSPIITSNADQAVFDITGDAPNVSDFSNFTALSGITMSVRFVELLTNGTPADYSDDDPRMDVLARMRADGTQDEAEGRALGFIGTQNGDSEITAKVIAEEHNSTKLRPIFQENRGLWDFGYITHAELQFILAEAALMGWNVPESAETYYNNGIQANFDYWGIAMPDGFLDRSDISFANAADQLEQLLNQKWIAGLGVNMFDTWGDFKRTGKPSLTLGAQVTANGFTTVPNRMFYPILESQINSTNYQAASSTIGGDMITVRHWYQN